MIPSDIRTIRSIPKLSTVSNHVLTFALAGQPNVGKSTIFNMLTGLKQHVGNWPGKTVEQKSGLCHHDGLEIQIVDLPGTYSLTANSPEERIARDFIIKASPDVVVVIVNAAALERDLYLISELLWLPSPLVVGLNMMDVASQQGFQIEPHVLEAALNVPVVPMSASRGQGVLELLETAIRMAEQEHLPNPKRPEIREDHKSVLEELVVRVYSVTPEPYPPEWVALKLLEGDREITQLMQDRMGEDWQQVHAILIQHEDAILAIASGRYEWIGRMMRAGVTKPKAGQVALTDKIDRFATHPVWGLLILFAVLGFTFSLTFTIGVPIQNWLDAIIVQSGSAWAADLLSGSPAWLQGLVIHGLIAGVGTVLTLLPILVIFFAAMGLLEDLGYMARAAFVMDRFMHSMGLHGKSFLPLFMGFGCNVPAVMGARIIEDPKARLATILITPLVPCTARLAVLAFMAPIFFGNSAILVSWGLVGLSLLTLLALGVVFHELFLGGEHKAFIMELPLYHLPNRRTILQSVSIRGIDFLRTAGSVILVMSIVLWALSSFPGGTIHTSYLAGIGRLLAPVGSWMGLDWRMMVALLSSFVRKENTIPTLAVLFAAGEQNMSLASVLPGSMTNAAALAFLTVQILFIPCLATLASIRQETGSWRWTIIDFILILAISLVAGVLVYQIASLFI